jgi:hypothetical protein
MNINLSGSKTKIAILFLLVFLSLSFLVIIQAINKNQNIQSQASCTCSNPFGRVGDLICTPQGNIGQCVTRFGVCFWYQVRTCKTGGCKNGTCCIPAGRMITTSDPCCSPAVPVAGFCVAPTPTPIPIPTPPPSTGSPCVGENEAVVNGSCNVDSPSSNIKNCCPGLACYYDKTIGWERCVKPYNCYPPFFSPSHKSMIGITGNCASSTPHALAYHGFYNTGCYPHDVYFQLYDEKERALHNSGWLIGAISSRYQEASWSPPQLSDGIYKWRVRIRNSKGQLSDYDSAGTIFEVDTTPITLSSCSVVVQKTNGSERIPQVIWEKPTNTGCFDVDKYLIEATKGYNFNKACLNLTYIDKNETSLSLENSCNLLPGEFLTVRIKVRDSAGRMSPEWTLCSLR